jgi:hypothetical protein
LPRRRHTSRRVSPLAAAAAAAAPPPALLSFSQPKKRSSALLSRHHYWLTLPTYISFSLILRLPLITSQLITFFATQEGQLSARYFHM